MLKNKNRKVNKFAAAAEASNQGRAVFTDNGKSYNLNRDYPYRLNFYLKTPPSEITIEEFEVYGLDRLQVLRAIENATIRNKDLKSEIAKVVDKYLPLKSNLSKSEDLYEERRKDHISHFVLRLAYCRNPDLQNWFIKQESALFRYRFEQETMEEKKNFLQDLNLNWRVLPNDEKEAMRNELEICTKPKPGVSIQDYISAETFFEVDFEKVPHMISTRSVYIKQGKAYVPMSDQINIAMTEFKTQLTKSVEATSKVLPRMEEDERLKPILHNIEKQYTGKSYETVDFNATGVVTANDVDGLIHHHAPLCMRNLHESLKADKHLKHGGRLQYGLFLKGIGLSVEEALRFWRIAFSSMTDDKFNKEYAYNVRYNYGLEGRRVNYKPYSCMKIISDNPPTGDEHHGCPFRHFSSNNLEARLRKDQVREDSINEIVELARRKHYQVACTKYFEVTHPQNKEKIDAIEHPNQYFEQSRKLAEEEQNSTEQIEDSMEIDDE